MMASRCGIDLVEIARFQRWLKRCDPEQMQRIFTVAEWDYCYAKHYPIQSLAARFAIKEACMKLFPAEANRMELDFIDIEVVMNSDGAPCIQLSDKLKVFLQRYKLNQINISISHTSHYACGIAIAE